MSSIALSCARSSRVVAARRATRALATETLASSSSTSVLSSPSPANTSSSKGKGREFNSTDHDGKSVYVRTWDDIGSMPEFFAVLRGVEKRFGPVREFRVARDPDITTKYHSYFMLEFADDAAFDRIPANGTNIKVAVPVVKKDLPGGLGLADLQGLLEQQERDPNLATDAPEGTPGAGLGLYGTPISVVNDVDRPTRVVEVVVQRAKRDATPTPRQRSLFAHRTFGPAFFEWGGFYAPTPEDPRPVPADMAAALDKWREFTLKDPRRAPHYAADGQGQEAAGGTGGTEVWREAEAAQRAAEEEQAQREEMEVMLRGVAEPGSWQSSATAAAAALSAAGSSTTKGGAVQIGGVEPAEVVEGEREGEGEDEGEKTPRLSRKEQILARARLHAKTPAPEMLSEEEVLEQAAKKQFEKRQKEVTKQAEVSTLRERLLKLVGGKWL